MRRFCKLIFLLILSKYHMSTTNSCKVNLRQSFTVEESKIEVYIKMIHAKDIVIVISWLTKLLLEGTLKKFFERTSSIVLTFQLCNVIQLKYMITTHVTFQHNLKDSTISYIVSNLAQNGYHNSYAHLITLYQINLRKIVKNHEYTCIT